MNAAFNAVYNTNIAHKLSIDECSEMWKGSNTCI